VFVGSIAGRQPLPLHGVYAATKAFDLFVGEALWGELRGTGIDVLVLEPAAAVVGVALDALGKQPSVVSGWMNWVTANTSRFMPRATMAMIAERFVARWTPADRK